MLNYKQRVMEDLDALLADLQSTTAHISSFQQQQAEQEQYQNRRPDIVSSQSSPRTSTPSPLPSQLTDHNDTSQLRRNDKAHGCSSLKQHIAQENSTHHHHHHHHHHHQQQQQQQHHHSYSSERTSSSSSNSGATYHQERSSASSTLSQSSLPGLSPVGYNKPIGSGSVSSGSNSSLGANASSQMSSTINSNLSELDQLLQDLNSAHFLDEVNRRTNSNQSQFVNGNSQRVVTSPGQVPSSTGSQSVQPPVAPKPNRVETNNRANVDAMLHELDHGVPPPPVGASVGALPPLNVTLPPLTKAYGEPITPPFPVPPTGPGNFYEDALYDDPQEFKSSANTTVVTGSSSSGSSSNAGVQMMSHRGHSVPDSQRRFVHESSPIPVIVISEPASVSEETGHRQPPLPSPPLPMPPSYSASVGKDPYEDPRQTGATTQMSSTTPPPPLPPSSLPLSQPFPGFPHMESAVMKQSSQSSTSDGNYSSFQSSETVKSSSMSTHSTSADETCGTTAFTGLVDVPSAFAPVHPLGPAPVISEQMESKTSQSYSKLESTDSKSEVMQKSEQSTMERSEKYAMSSSTLQQQQQQQQQHQQLPQLQQPPLMMMMMSNKMQSESQGQGLPIADMNAPPFPVQQSYETKSEQSHIYKKIEHSDVSQGFPCPPPPPPPLAPSAQPIPLQIGAGQADSYYQQQQQQYQQQQQQQDSSPGYQVLSPFQSSQHYESSVSEQQQQHQQQQQQEVVTSSMQQHSSVSASDNFQSRQMAGVNSAATTVGQHPQIGGQVYGQNATYIQQPLYQETPMMSPQTASTATRELDELMASLSEFRVSNRDNSVAQQVAGGDPAYARPHKLRNESAGTTSAATSSMSATSVTAKGDQLDSMLGSLQSDMNRQGVSTKTKGLCAACNKPVVSQMITALGKVWHVEHFTCAHCNMTLGTMSFYERDNKAYCEKDYHSLFAPRCAYCNGPIVDKCVTALDKTWHPEHFFCGLCGRNFGDEGFHERDGQAYCREDFLKMFAPKCGGCAQPIKDSYISALNRHWHPDCFVCWKMFLV
ncbi:PDZ and LIM domain protein Zasp isoform X1 [Octopus bimaculoides]|uniref:PDZ and LIM domain protein Zasp isoform X1 n=1 Tax=Octopus bimaculoides TaxID=37653 RepID=UPI0022E206C5|nr:PDZ and LIM domain protein Zasp isoform X1 [Octopus bimaculoides]